MKGFSASWLLVSQSCVVNNGVVFVDDSSCRVVSIDSLDSFVPEPANTCHYVGWIAPLMPLEGLACDLDNMTSFLTRMMLLHNLSISVGNSVSLASYSLNDDGSIRVLRL